MNRRDSEETSDLELYNNCYMSLVSSSLCSFIHAETNMKHKLNRSNADVVE